MSVTYYPNVQKEEPTTTADVKTFRLSNITQIQRELEQDLSKYNKTKRTYSSVFNAFTYVNTGMATAVALATGTGAGLLATGVGTPVAFALGCISLGLGACSLVLSAANKKVMPKLQKHTALVQLITAKRSSFRLIISKALADSNISVKEFNRLQADYDDYK